VRKNNCFSDGTYRLLSERITRAMAEHFADTPNVIGWQTDNEFGHPSCYCDGCRASFQDWLRGKYASLDTLNKAWGTHFWGHTVRAWEEIPIPTEIGSHNPSACLDWQRHFSWLNVRFQRDQVKILRAACPRHFVTHNLMGLFPDINYFDFAEDLDFVAWDDYPAFGAPGIRYNTSMGADLMRGLKKKNFWLMETNAGPGGWGAFSRNVRPGEMRSIAFQQVAHGCDHYVWFRWRTCTAGREQYWHGLLGHDGKPLRRYQEAATVARELHALASHLADTTVKAEVAMVYDYDSLWATRIQPSFDQNDYRQALRRYYNALLRAGVTVDMVPPGVDLDGYRLVLAPQLYLLPDNVADALAEFVRKGGVLLNDCRTGVKDATGLCHERTLPGKLAKPLGIRIEEYESLQSVMEYALKGVKSMAGTFTATQYADWITPESAQALCSYDQWHLRPFAGVTRNTYGKGVGWYVGTIVKEDAFYDRLIAALLRDARIKPIVKPPLGVEIGIRTGTHGTFLFVINHCDEPRRVSVPAGKRELLTGKRTGASVNLDRYGVAVIAL
jgi:beta-galactosidase